MTTNLKYKRANRLTVNSKPVCILPGCVFAHKDRRDITIGSFNLLQSGSTNLGIIIHYRTNMVHESESRNTQHIVYYGKGKGKGDTQSVVQLNAFN